ncbi:MAG: flagellar motor protein MotB [Alphaproteobacteria bacterium]
MNTNDPIIIKRKVKKEEHESHGGGTWKIAYADFVTAMMGFFMLMWLINVLSGRQKVALSEYFSGKLHGILSGSKGILTGQSISQQEKKKNIIFKDSSGITKGERKKDIKLSDKKVKEGAFDASDPDPLQKQQKLNKVINNTKLQNEEYLLKFARFLYRNLQSVNSISNLSEHVSLQLKPEGMLVQIFDKEQRSMFPVGSFSPYPYTKDIIKSVAITLKKWPNKIVILGHTDSLPYATYRNYSNWELSTERAHTCRRILEECGLGMNRIDSIVGKGDTEPLIKSNPRAAANRRIGILIRWLPSQKANTKGIRELREKVSNIAKRKQH